jgi:hypothetical protein
MKTRSLVALMIGVLIAGGVARAAADVSGKWSFSIQFPNGVDTHLFEFKQDGEKLTGTGSGALTTIKTVAGTVKGDAVAFTVTGTNIRGESMTIDYAGKIVSTGRMTGTVDYHKGPAFEFTATRK